jgi:Zn-dependent metalloprotease
MDIAINYSGLKSRLAVTFLLAGIIIGVSAAPSAAASGPAEENVTPVMETLRFYNERGSTEPAREEEAPRLIAAPEGHLRNMAAPPGHAFQPRQIVAGKPDETARIFLNDNKVLFGMSSANVSLAPYQTRSSSKRTYVRLQQSYAGVPVFGGQVAVQLNDAQGVEFVGADVSAEVNTLDGLDQWTAPSILAQEATTIASDLVHEEGGVQFSSSTPQLMILVPSVLGETGPIRLVWEFTVDCKDQPEFNERWLVDAKSGEVARRYPLTHSALNRVILDSNSSTAWPGTVIRNEGEAVTGIMDADNAYTFLGDSYNFFQNEHGRDSYDDDGVAIRATVQYCTSTACPWGNAQWVPSAQRLRFGNGFATDDIVAHEFTHAVTEKTSGLIYANASGAINESLSDIWGEFVDLNNAGGNDAPSVRWDVGEDLPGGRLRSMSDPTSQGNDPDRLGSPNYIAAVNNPTTANDFGGVHSNSGVNNKLCYLLTDGDSFNGQSVFGMGIPRVADLYYEANANLLTSASGWTALYEALRQAAVNLNWNNEERSNLHRACLAVQIAAPNSLYVNGGVNCLTKTGSMQCIFPYGGPFQTVNQGVSGAWAGDGLNIRAGSYNESIIINKYLTLRAYDGIVYIGQ